MHVIDKHDPEKTVRDPEFVDHLSYACGRGILADFRLEPTDTKWPNQLYGNIHLYPRMRAGNGTLFNNLISMTPAFSKARFDKLSITIRRIIPVYHR